ncbi:P-loop containing nucleoside triphosphate hydrolase protein [Boeremia exigua]|uniref:P-loop containing nucleoside triphosphate hydrolase protein n=1 Tax=Boeremia exigua TaxID=749465 RepID=UPI001E8DCB8F|nr:P-loop containing nucleoside triphosphate hydrolase protein [Boeremia exigua]KAH6620358.1 P-loop containing nucleoside triphosphate hydrolase protein [Boeremia exigua]
MAANSDSRQSEEVEKIATQADEEQRYAEQIGWKALFAFTTNSHLVVLISALASAAVAATTLPIFSVLYGLVFGAYSDYGAGKFDGDKLLSEVSRLCLILTGIAAANWVLNSIFFFLFLFFGELQAKSARTRIFKVLLQKDMSWFDMRDSGIAAFLPTIQMHIRDLQLSVSAPLGEGLQCVTAAIAAMGVAFYYSWNLTLVIISTVPLIYLVEAYLSKRLNARTHEQANQLQMALKYITNAIQSIETVKCYNGESYELQSFTTTTSLAAKLYKRVANLRSMQIGLIKFFTFTVFVQGFAYGSYLIRSGSIDVKSVITTFWAALLAIGGITGFLPQFIVMQKGKVSGARLRSVIEQMSREDEPYEMQGEFKPSACPGDIEFSKVTFSYPTRADQIALQDATLFFPAGETTFVVGKSGSGKSTLGQLLVRFYQPHSGQVLLDHVPINKLDVQWLRQNVTLVEQHSVLFNDNIHNNILLGDRSGSITMDDIKNAVSFAMLDPVVEALPAGLETDLGAKGSSLSGGQKQRMALARARIRDSPVLILDESTSALDYVTRAMILDAIRKWRDGKTTIVITHDISQIQPDDFLYLLDKAHVLQEGYRKDLEAQPGAFQLFLDSHEEKEDPQSDLSEGEDDDAQSDEIVSLYREFWTMPTPTRRPLSAVLFGQSVLSSFQAEGALGRSDTVSSRADIVLSRIGDEENNTQKERNYFHQASSVPRKIQPEPLSAISDISGLDQFDTARTSRTLLDERMSRRYLFQERDSGSRPVSQVLPRPISSHSTYPRRLSVAAPRTSHLPQPGQYSVPREFRSKPSTENIPDESKVPSDSLPITQILRSVWPNINWRSRIALFAAILATIVHAVATPVFAWVFSQLLATFYALDDTKAEAIRYIMIILSIAIIDGFAEYFMFFLYDSVAQAWVQRLKTEAMRRVLSQPREFFDKDENSMVRLAETLDHFAEEARNLPGRFAGIFFSMFLVLVVSVIWSLAISWKVTLVALASGPVLFVITQAYNMISSHWENLANEAADNVSQVLHETFVNIRTVRCLTLEDHFRKKYEQATNNAIHVGVKRAIYSGSIFGLLNTSAQFVIITLFWFGAWLISRNVHSVLSITETFMILMLSINDISQMSQYMTQVNISREAGARLLHLARLPENSHEGRGTQKIEIAGDISFNNVSFTYPTRRDHQVLHNISFSIPRGSCTAIVGSSGSGKSTVAALLLKLYPTNQNIGTFLASEGKDLTVSGQNIKTLHTSSLRSHMAIVSQTPVIFPGTIAQNIAYAVSPSSPESSLESIRAAADAAGVSEFIDSLPNGYQTLIGDGGTVLSGGQSQRIAIARALVRNPDILILDEATSALDAIAAATIRETILRLVASPTEHDDTVDRPLSPRSRAGGFWDGKDWEPSDGVVGSPGWLRARGKRAKGKGKKKQMTVIIITHAREMMSIAEHIIMLDKGRVIEEGGYAELKRKRSGAFAKLLRGEAE